MDLGSRFAMFRNRTGLTQKEAAEQLNITPYQLGNYETNRSEPNIATLKRMSHVYGVSIDQLVGNRKPSSVLPEVQDKESVSVDEIKEALTEILAKIDSNN